MRRIVPSARVLVLPSPRYVLIHVAVARFLDVVIFSTFVSVPADFGGLSVDSYISGIVAGVLEGAGFLARVTAHTVSLDDGDVPASTSTSSGSFVQGLPQRKEKTIFLVKFAPSVLSRDAQV